MPEPIKPPLMAKAALVTGRVVQKPFEVPQEFTTGTTAVGRFGINVTHDFAAAARMGVEDLKPRGPAKLLLGLFDRIGESAAKSAERGQRNLDTFWKPFSKASDDLGHAIANPFASFYAKRAGIEIPADNPDTPNSETADALGAIIDPDPYVRWPQASQPPADGGAGDAGGEAPAPGGETPPADTPPADTPPGDTPPAEQPPAEQPPAEQPPAEQPPAEQPPAEQPPAEQPPAEQPPAEQPPAEQPPAEQPPAEQPPAEQPPAEQPPAEQPPAEQPPAEQPPAEQPAEQPHG